MDKIVGDNVWQNSTDEFKGTRDTNVMEGTTYTNENESNNYTMGMTLAGVGRETIFSSAENNAKSFRL